jgi:hypothetical protein
MLQPHVAYAPSLGWTEPTAEAVDLFWSKRGEVACERHAPEKDAERWRDEQWTLLRPLRQRLTYQCQHCNGDVPISRRRRVVV